MLMRMSVLLQYVTCTSYLVATKSTRKRRYVAYRTGFGYLSFRVQENIRSALWTRLHDSSQTVIDALYAEPSKLIALFSTNVTGYIVALADIIHPQPPISTPARSIIRAHLDFLVSHLLLTPTLKSPDLDRLAFEKVIFPLLLLSKPRLKTARAAWATLELDAASGGLAALPLVAAALESYSWEGSRSEAAGTLVGKRKRPEAGSEPEISIETMARTNIAVAARMSGTSFLNRRMHSWIDCLAFRGDSVV